MHHLSPKMQHCIEGFRARHADQLAALPTHLS